MVDELEMELDLRLYWRLFLKWFWLIALAAFLAGGAACAVSRWFIEPVYQASVQLLIQPSNSFGSTDYQDDEGQPKSVWGKVLPASMRRNRKARERSE